MYCEAQNIFIRKINTSENASICIEGCPQKSTDIHQKTHLCIVKFEIYVSRKTNQKIYCISQLVRAV